jgi:DNA-binding response OmpR family regulator/anti-sigma regulatory factor (Ser/Thr protein kinase)
MKMQVQRMNIVPFVRKIMDNFESIAEEHQIDFVLETEKNDLFLWIDNDKFEKIVFNLLSNAFKYTSNGKMIVVFIREDQDTVAVEVRDQGIGIAENKKNSIFVRFEHLVDKNLFNQSSSGIGLSLVKELVEMHRATISVESKLGEGSSFMVEFRKGKEHYDESVEYILEDSNKVTAFEKVVDKRNPSVTEEVPVGDAAGNNHPRQVMLLVEDNQELRNFLRSIFSLKFKVIEAADGMEGWSKALKFLPDIIISDVIMPEKDGIEMMKELRKDMTTSHIPVVLLTAQSAIENKLEGLEYGADDYITKPFSATYLQARVDNILLRRSKLQEIYRANLMGDNSLPAETTVTGANGTDASEPEGCKQPGMTGMDRKFITNLMELMEKNMDNGDLMVDYFARELAVSRSVFFKKLKMLIGLAPIEFIKEMRIKRAAQLIETGEFNMTQISYMVGINDPRYFSKCFKQKFNMTPTEYRDKIFGK